MESKKRGVETRQGHRRKRRGGGGAEPNLLFVHTSKRSSVWGRGVQSSTHTEPRQAEASGHVGLAEHRIDPRCGHETQGKLLCLCDSGRKRKAAQLLWKRVLGTWASPMFRHLAWLSDSTYSVFVCIAFTREVQPPLSEASLTERLASGRSVPF